MLASIYTVFIEADTITMALLDVFVEAVICHIGLTIWEPAVEELI